ncbi:unnamed protein product [Ostreobium quekettii]|uniref:MMS19 nucleotide excision repair protein n=1 Tax=Ostreobium quekettii TaxID=121088 RepID=A0A8S1JD17_9CHLO|nr:unnamed protein product [Ostreobium quekettii]|eukprot:evm.model.scf_2337.2 EVM.evm.TU.scf_2337.2   scf_2337:18090-19885(-)
MPEREDVADLLSKCVSLERDSPERAEKAARLKSGVQNGATNLLQLVVLMEKYLTANDDSVRAQGVALLAEIVSSGVKLSSSEQQHLADFFTSRFADWASLNGALAGCQALLDGEPDEEIVCLVAESLTMELHIQQHKQADRQLALKLLLKLISDWGSTLVLSAHMSVLDATIAAVDGEKDPRCLMLAFECVAVIQTGGMSSYT